ncbi:T9SS type A sorting domain-containing protein [uncultured Aquimarina sp.]|uniref:poly(ethylene terephthalate) hydrolase family protein n=1 Tax=uncultured Aquimarina sp. TaxID=575652 RepID=UPI002636B848|nr:T9SS type A sorting domain-containing protein [uncultured Aquimarina sp.]
MIKNLQVLLLVVVVTLTGFHSSYAQCNDVTLQSISNPGPYDVETLTESDGLRNGPDYSGGTVYYPTNGTPPYPSIAIVPGFTSTPAAVRAWGPYYASHGIIAIVIGTNSGFDFPDVRARALIDALETLREENTRASSPIIGQIDVEKFATSGHSMGGGGAQRAAVLDSRIKAVVALCPWLPTNSTPELNHAAPVLIFSGQNDTTAQPSQHANIHYNETSETTDKLLYEIKNGNHSVANTPAGAEGNVGKLAISWLKLKLSNDSCYCPLINDQLLDNPSTASSFDTNTSCQTLSIDEIDSNDELTTRIYPNPANSYVTVESNFTISKRYKIFSVLGEHLVSGRINTKKEQIDLSQLKPNIYLLNIDNQVFKILKIE